MTQNEGRVLRKSWKVMRIMNESVLPCMTQQTRWHLDSSPVTHLLVMNKNLSFWTLSWKQVFSDLVCLLWQRQILACSWKHNPPCVLLGGKKHILKEALNTRNMHQLFIFRWISLNFYVMHNLAVSDSSAGRTSPGYSDGHLLENQLF